MTPEDAAGPLESYAVGSWRVERWARLSSTNDEARRRALDGDAGRLWIVADAQDAGRGRRGRVWESPAGNLYASALLLDPCPTERAAEIGFVAGVAVQRAVADLGAGEARLKWPNDLVADGAKLAGLLCEGITTPQRRFAVSVGVGVNVASSPEGLAYPTTSLTRLTGRSVQASELRSRLALRFEEALTLWARGVGFAALREAWLAKAAGIGGPIRVDDGRQTREGIFAGVDGHGRLMLERGGSVEIVESADLTLISA